MSLIHEIDYGTPASTAEKMVTLTIDGREITVPEGTSIMRASMEMPARRSPSSAPPTWSTPSAPAGSAWSRSRAAPARRPPARRRSARHGRPDPDGPAEDIRKGVMELYISDHPLDCLTCAANGDCELQDMAGAVGLRDVRYGYEGENHVFAKKNGARTRTGCRRTSRIRISPTIRRSASSARAACAPARRCRARFALTIEGRGFDSRVSPGMHEELPRSECVSCGACVQACPTATLTEKSVIEIGQPEHSVVTTCAYCGVGCSFKAEMRGEELVRMVPWKDGKANRGHSCVKGRFAYGAMRPTRSASSTR
jgi:formate dehydrogenase major subunit